MNLMNKADSDTTAIAAEDYSQSAKAQTSALVFLITIAALALALTVTLAIYITKALTRPISEIEEAAKRCLREILRCRSATFQRMNWAASLRA